MVSGMRRVLAVAASVVLIATSAACSRHRSISVPVAAGSASLAVGETLRVDMGDVNASIGDAWYVTGAPDPAVLTEKGTELDHDCRQTGCGGRLTWIFTATGPGTTTVVFQYCYRSGPDDCQPQPGRGPSSPVPLTVTVARR
jgi:predicted secreted protein